MTTKKTTTRKTTTAPRKTRSAKLKNPNGESTPAAREHYRKTEGASLQPGVKGSINTPIKLKRKGSFLTRIFGHSRAWGEAVPRTMASARRLATKGRLLLQRYSRSMSKKTA